MAVQHRPRRLGLWLALGLGIAGVKLWQNLRQADLRGQVVLITGSSRGLGLALARAFAREGCRIVLCARNAPELRRAQTDLVQRGATAIAIPCDVTDAPQVRNLIDEASRQFGRIDILVNNAGVIQVGPVFTATEQDFEDAFNTMFWGALYAIEAVLPQMQARRSGRIVNITSIGGKVGMPHLLPYTCAKFAAVGLSEGLRTELGSQGIVVTTIVPGLMRTGSHLQAQFRGQQEREFTWFSLGASLPLISMNAQRAAQQIVQATKRGEAERILSLPANLLGRFHGLFPGTTANLLQIANRFLPTAEHAAPAARVKGMDLDARLSSGWFDTLTRLGRSAAHRLNQIEVGRTPRRP
jgi:NAD(P)-dependent dehydrogenase (short-subunit alcohol dehydrogenase family)